MASASRSALMFATISGCNTVRLEMEVDRGRGYSTYDGLQLICEAPFETLIENGPYLDLVQRSWGFFVVVLGRGVSVVFVLRSGVGVGVVLVRKRFHDVVVVNPDPVEVELAFEIHLSQEDPKVPP